MQWPWSPSAVLLSYLFSRVASVAGAAADDNLCLAAKTCEECLDTDDIDSDKVCAWCISTDKCHKDGDRGCQGPTDQIGGEDGDHKTCSIIEREKENQATMLAQQAVEEKEEKEDDEICKHPKTCDDCLAFKNPAGHTKAGEGTCGWCVTGVKDGDGTPTCVRDGSRNCMSGETQIGGSDSGAGQSCSLIESVKKQLEKERLEEEMQQKEDLFVDELCKKATSCEECLHIKYETKRCAWCLLGAKCTRDGARHCQGSEEQIGGEDGDYKNCSAIETERSKAEEFFRSIAAETEDIEAERKQMQAESDAKKLKEEL